MRLLVVGGRLVPVWVCNQTRAIVNDHLSTECKHQHQSNLAICRHCPLPATAMALD